MRTWVTIGKAQCGQKGGIPEERLDDQGRNRSSATPCGRVYLCSEKKIQRRRLGIGV